MKCKYVHRKVQKNHHATIRKKVTLQINSNKSLARFHSLQMPVMLIKHLKMVDFGKDLLHILVLAVILSCSIIILIFRRITHHNNHVVKVRHNMHFMPNTLGTNNAEENNNQSYHLKRFRANFLSLRYKSNYTVGISIC